MNYVRAFKDGENPTKPGRQLSGAALDVYKRQALHRAFGNLQRFGNFLLAVATKVAHLRDLRQTRIRLLQSLERLVYGQNRLLRIGQLLSLIHI